MAMHIKDEKIGLKILPNVRSAKNIKNKVFNENKHPRLQLLKI